MPAADFIRAFADHLNKTQKIAVPKWQDMVKTSCRNELAPYNTEWLYVRAAALARKVYLRQNIGVGALKHIYGGKWRRGVRTPRHGAASKKIIRYCLMELVNAGILEKDRNNDTKRNSRRVSKAGRGQMDSVARNLTA